MKNGQNRLQPILSVCQPVTMDTILNKNGLKDVKYEQTLNLCRKLIRDFMLFLFQKKVVRTRKKERKLPHLAAIEDRDSIKGHYEIF